jgi:glycosyltransferase involved in cell wall biosynthesis
MPLVSVIIPVYNGEKFIGQALESVYSQTFRDFEVVVIDDGSTDGTLSVLDAYRDRLILLKNSHGGPASSRNRGLEIARGSFIAFLDADDIWVPSKLERQVAVALAHPEYGIITADAATFDHTGITEQSAAAHKFIPSGFVLEALLFDNWIANSCVLVRRECFDKVGFFDEDPFVRGEDWIMWMRIAAHYQVFFQNEVLLHYRRHGQNYSHTNLEKQFDDLFINFDKVERQISKLAARPDLMREAKFRVCFRRGKDDLRILALDRARAKLRRAVGYKPLSAKAWLLLGVAYIPSQVLAPLRNLMRACRRLIRHQTETGR